MTYTARADTLARTIAERAGYPVEYQYGYQRASQAIKAAVDMHIELEDTK